MGRAADRVNINTKSPRYPKEAGTADKGKLARADADRDDTQDMVQLLHLGEIHLGALSEDAP